MDDDDDDDGDDLFRFSAVARFFMGPVVVPDMGPRYIISTAQHVISAVFQTGGSFISINPLDRPHLVSLYLAEIFLRVRILFSVSLELFFLHNLVILELFLQNISIMLLEMEDLNQLRRDTRDMTAESQE